MAGFGNFAVWLLVLFALVGAVCSEADLSSLQSQIEGGFRACKPPKCVYREKNPENENPEIEKLASSKQVFAGSPRAPRIPNY